MLSSTSLDKLTKEKKIKGYPIIWNIKKNTTFDIGFTIGLILPRLAQVDRGLLIFFLII